MVRAGAIAPKPIGSFRRKPPRSAADSVPQDDHAVAEPALLDQLQVQPHTVREEPLSPAHDYGADDHLELVDKTAPYRLRGELTWPAT
jgi:hypothetical protein